MWTEREEQIIQMLVDKIPDDYITAVMHVVNTPERAEMMYLYLKNCKEITKDGVMSEVIHITQTTTAEGERYYYELQEEELASFGEINQKLIMECIKEEIDIERIKELLDDGADINAFDEEYEQSLYEKLLDFYKEWWLNPVNLYQITELFMKKGLIIDPKPGDSDYLLPSWFRFLQPEKLYIDTYKLLLEKGTFTYEGIEDMISDFILDLHLDRFYFFNGTKYSQEDSIEYYLDLIRWACAYNVERYPEKCSRDLLSFDWSRSEKTTLELNRYGCSTSVFVEDLETHERTEINGWG